MVRLQMASKTATIQYKPVTSLAGNNNTLAHYEQSMATIKYHMHYPISMACMSAAVIIFEVISIYSLNPGKLPGHFSYERPGYEASFHSETFLWLVYWSELE